MRQTARSSTAGGGGGGGSVGAGILQLASNAPLDTTLRFVEDQAGTDSPLQLSTTEAAIITTASNGFKWKSAFSNTYTALYSTGVATPSNSNYMLMGDSTTTYLNADTTLAIGVGNNQQLGLNSTRFYVSTNTSFGGTFNPSARIHARGDGSNPIARFEDNAGTPTLRVENSLMRFGASTAFGSIAYAMTGTTFSGNNNGTGLGFYSQFSIAASSDRYDFAFGGDAVANDAGSVTHLALSRNFAAGAGAANYRPLGIYYTINNSGAQTGTATGIYTRATETNLNSMIHNLIDLGTVGLGSLFSVTNKGAIKVATIADADAPNSSLYYSSTASKLVWKDSGGVVNNLY